MGGGQSISAPRHSLQQYVNRLKQKKKKSKLDFALLCLLYLLERVKVQELRTGWDVTVRVLIGVAVLLPRRVVTVRLPIWGNGGFTDFGSVAHWGNGSVADWSNGSITESGNGSVADRSERFDH